MAHRQQTADGGRKDDFEQARLGNIAYFEMGQSPSSDYVSDEEIGVPFLQGNAEFGTVFPKAQFYCSQSKKLCKPGDVLISVRAPVGDLNKADQTYVIGRGLAAVRFTDISSDFGWHLLNYWAKDLDSVAQGTTFRAISKGDLAALEVRLPPLLEQRRIAGILDAADAAIRETERVIAKLREVKQGLLHDLLTRGLDAHGHLRDPAVHPEQFKDSPLGRIPREWEVRPFGELITLEYGDGLTASERTGSGYPVFGSSGIVGRHFEYLVEGPGIIVGRKGTVGAVTWTGGSFWPIDTTYYVELRESSVTLRWIYRLLRYLKLGKLDTSTGVPGLNRHDVYDLRVALPDLKEQRRIAAVLDAHDACIRAEEAVLPNVARSNAG